MSRSVEIIIDEQPYQAQEGSLLIDLLIKHQLKVPYFCYHEALGADGNCRMCMVGIEGQKRPQIACDTLIKAGMVVSTKSESIQEVRRNILELELINHPIDCPVCDQAGECSLQDFYMDYGLYESEIDQDDKVTHQKHIDLGANVMLDQERCVLCARCTRFTDQVTHSHELGIIGRGDRARVATMPGRPLSNPYAMNVVDLCPVGALTSKDFRFKQRVWFLHSAAGICHGCAKGCNIYIDHNKNKYEDDTVYRFRPRRNDAINGFFICDTGRLSYKTAQQNRQKKLMIDAQEASEKIALERFKTLIHQNEGQITMVLSPALYSEEIEAVVALAKRLGAALYAPLDFYEDRDFEDTMLRCRYRGANSALVLKMGLDTALPKKPKVLINFNHEQDFEADIQIDFRTHQNRRNDLVFPIATYLETGGHLENIDGIVQQMPQTLFPNEPLPSILEWIKRLGL